MAKKITPPASYKELPHAVVNQMLTLATSGFGLVAALAWNEVIKETVNVYIKPYFPKESGLITLLIYAIIITTLAVIVTLQLSSLQAKFIGEHPEHDEEKVVKKKSKNN